MLLRCVSPNLVQRLSPLQADSAHGEPLFRFSVSTLPAALSTASGGAFALAELALAEAAAVAGGRRDGWSHYLRRPAVS